VRETKLPRSRDNRSFYRQPGTYYRADRLGGQVAPSFGCFAGLQRHGWPMISQ
jgi:hypothetical protein